MGRVGPEASRGPGESGGAARRDPRRVLGTWLALGAVALLAACGPATFTWAGPEILAGVPVGPVAPGPLARALPEPRLEVVPGRPLEGWLAPVEVAEHAAIPGTTAHRMLLRTQDGATVRVAYDVGARRTIPVAVGEAAAMRYYPPREDGRSGGALVVATPRGRALAFLVVDGGLPSGVLPGGATIGLRDAADHATYTEVRRLANLCLARIEHDDLALTTEDATTWVSPGTVRRVTIAETAFDLVVFDASRPVDDRCGALDLVHTSWALVAAGSPADQAEADAVRPSQP